MNVIVTYKTKDEYTDFVRYNNTNITKALLATAELANFYEGGAACEVNEFYRAADKARPKSVNCTAVDSTKQWASLRLSGRSNWLYLPPLLTKGWITVSRKEAVNRMLATSDGWAWARLNIMSKKSRTLFEQRQAAGYHKQIHQIEEYIAELRKEQNSLKAKADKALGKVKK